jgi:hypothetical protein
VKKDFFSRGKIFYDAINQRERVIDEVILGSDKEFYDVLYLHSLQTEFRYSFKNKTCQVQKTTRDWRDFRIPDDATRSISFLFDVFVGFLLNRKCSV